MSSRNLSVLIRNAKPDEFETLARLHATAFATDPVVQILWSKADPSALRKWYWIDGAQQTVKQGNGTVIVAERKDSGDVVGLAWFVRVTESNPPSIPAAFPEGYNVMESAKMRGSRITWQNGLLTRYGEYTYLDSLAVLPASQGQGLGARLMSSVIDAAKERGHNIALCASPGKNGFYEKFGFKEVLEPVKLCDGKQEGFNSMLLELPAPTDKAV